MDSSWVEVLGLCGSIGSIIGVAINFFQIRKVKCIAETTKQVTEETQASLQFRISLIDVVKHCETIKRILEALNNEEYEIALILLRELKCIVIELNTIEWSCEFEHAVALKTYIPKLATDITNLQNYLKTKTKKFKMETMILNLDNLHTVMNSLQANLKYKAI